jgi:hypothetical protein
MTKKEYVWIQPPVFKPHTDIRSIRDILKEYRKTTFVIGFLTFPIWLPIILPIYLIKEVIRTIILDE